MSKQTDELTPHDFNGTGKCINCGVAANKARQVNFPILCPQRIKRFVASPRPSHSLEDLREELEKGLLLAITKVRLEPNKLGGTHFDVPDDALDGLMALIANAVVSKLDEIGEPLLTDFEIPTQEEYDRMVEVITWYEDRITELKQGMGTEV